MSPIRRSLPGEPSRRTELLGVVAANALPIVGVVALGWNATALLLLYWLELGVDSVWALVRAVFAGRPPTVETDGVLIGPLAARQPTLGVPGTSLEVYLVTLVGMPLTVGIVLVGWLLVGAVLVGPVPEPDTGTLTSVVVAALGIFLMTGVTTVRTYIHDGEYRSHNAQTAFGGLLTKMGIVFVGGVVTLTIVTAATAGPSAELSRLDPSAAGLPLLLVIALCKFTADLGSVYRDRLAVYFNSYDREYGWLARPPEVNSVDATLDGETEQTRPAFWGRLLGGPLRLPYHTGCSGIALFGLVGAGLFATGQAWDLVTGLVVASLMVPVGLLCADQLLRYGAVEYRVAPEDGEVLVYDRLFDTVVWRLHSLSDCEVRLERTPVDRLLGTETVSIGHPEGEYLLPHLPDSAPVLAAIDREVPHARPLSPGRQSLLS